MISIITLRTFITVAFATWAVGMCSAGAKETQHWSGFRGNGATGVADGYPLPTAWNADPDAEQPSGVLWRTPVAGLGHSSPVIWADKLFLCTAVPEGAESTLQLDIGGKPVAADDRRKHRWVVLCYDKATGKELWRKTAHEGIPRATRHVKATQANTTLAVDGTNVVAFLGSEGLHCFDLDGTLKWRVDLGVIDISKYGIGWGYASSPAIHGDHIALACDDPSKPFAVVVRLSDGKELWRVDRDKISERSWGTPLIHKGPTSTHVVINGWPWTVSYDLHTGKELWKIKGGGDNPIPTPFVANDWIYITSAHGGQSPIHAVLPSARGDITPGSDENKKHFAWSLQKGGSYISTPVVYGDNIYLGSGNIIRSFNATTGEKVYAERFPSRAQVIASLVAGDGKIYCPSEKGTVYVLKAGAEFEVLSSNPMGEPCLATPAISEGVLYFRTTRSLVAIGEK